MPGHEISLRDGSLGRAASCSSTVVGYAPPAVGGVSRARPGGSRIRRSVPGRDPVGGCLPLGGRLVFGNDVGGHAAAVLDVDALFPGPGADRGGVDGAGGAAAGGSPGGAAGLAGVVDVFPSAVCSSLVCSALRSISYPCQAIPDPLCRICRRNSAHIDFYSVKRIV
jgi:hypothetical protein